MGFLDSILGKPSHEEKKDEPILGLAPVNGIPFSVSTKFHPMRLKSRTENSVDLLLEVNNKSPSAQLCSVVVEVPRTLGFDNVALSKRKELRLGALEGGASKHMAVTITANSQTPPGAYTIAVTVYSHYRDYTHVLNSAAKSIELRVV